MCGGPEICLGERVLVAGQRTGVVQFYGKTSFAPGQFLKVPLTVISVTALVQFNSFR